MPDIPVADRRNAPAQMTRLIAIMAALRTPQTGCPWDLEQTFATIAPYTIEEAYEVADAIARGDLDDMCDELGDLLLQVVFHARMAQEQGAFDVADVIAGICDKMIRRHPHVFGQTSADDAHAVTQNWANIKAQEKTARALRKGLDPDAPMSLLAAVKSGQPTLARALALQAKAGEVGFDWNDPMAVIAKIREELAEIESALHARDMKEAGAEVGDLLFAAVNLARHVKADPDAMLRATNLKFERRFYAIERALDARGQTFEQVTLGEMEDLWAAAKAAEIRSRHQAE